MQLDEGAVGRSGQLAYPPGLRATLVLREDPAGRQMQRVLGARRLRRPAMLDRVEASPTVRCRESIEEQPRRARMLRRRARPEDAVLASDPVVVDAAVVGRPTGAGSTELGEHLLRVGADDPVAAEPLAEPCQHLEVAGYAGRWVEGASPQDHPALEVRQRPGLLCPLRHRQHHIGSGRRLAQHDVGDADEVERLDPRRDVTRVGRGHDGVGAEDEQRTDAVIGAKGVEHLVRGPPHPRDVVGVDTPHRRHVPTGGRIVDAAIAR
jgi:hypothetical protein